MFLILHLSKEGYLTSVACEEGLTRMFCLQGGGVVKVQIKVHIGHFVYIYKLVNVKILGMSSLFVLVESLSTK